MPIIDLDKPKTRSHYLKILKSCETASLERYQTFFKLIAEAVDVMAVEFVPDGVFIPLSKFDGIGLSFNDAQSLQYMFSEDMNWSVLPSQSGQKKESMEGLSIKLPLKGEGPYHTNYWNLQKALADAILFRTSKTFPFEVNSQIIRIIRKLVEDAENFFPFIDATDDGLVLWVESYEEGKDDPTPKTITNLLSFYEYLDFSGAILVMDDNLLGSKRRPLHIAEWPHIDESSVVKRLLYTREEKIKICDPDKLKAIAASLEEKYQHRLEEELGLFEEDLAGGKKIVRVRNVEDRNGQGSIKAKTVEPGKVEKITFVRIDGSGRKTSVVVNEDYQRPIRVDVAKGYWKALFQVAERAGGNEDIDLLDAAQNKPIADYFNTNKSCKLYTRSGCELTKILKTEQGYIESAIEMEVVTSKAFEQRKNKGSRKTA